MNHRIPALLSATFALTAFAALYEINFAPDTTIDPTTRHLDAIALSSPSAGEQSAAVPQATDRLLFHDLTASARFSAKAGETLTASVDWSSNWMCAYLYIDYDNDGRFSPETELVTYSFLGNKNSLGATVSNNAMEAKGSCVAMPSFVLPSSLAAGEYRMRYVIDWDYADPGGRNTETNKITTNNGAIADATLVVEAASAPEKTYAVNFDADAAITHASRRLANINFAIPGLPDQTLAVGQDADRLLIHDSTPKVLVMPVGSTVSTTFGWTGTWMCSYIYLDRGNDGEFNTAIDAATGRPLPGSDVMAYSSFNGKNSVGQNSTGERITPPAFTLPSDITPGIYRMRVKIDWDCIDPAGNTASGNEITKNGGAITDLTVMVTEPLTQSALTVNAPHGALSLADGADANGATVPLTGSLGFKPVADEGYYFDGLTISRALSLPSGKTLINPAMSGDITIASSAAVDGVISVPVTELIGDPEITVHFIAEADAPKGGRYESDYSTAEKAESEGFTAISLNGKTLDVAATKCHTFVDAALNAACGSTLDLTAAYTGSATKFNLYIDMNFDGEFYGNTESLSCELMASTERTPSLMQATLPELLPAGVYRARIEAEGHCDADFLLNVYSPRAAYRSMAMNGMILNSEGGPMGETVEPFAELTLKTQPAVPGFDTDKVIVRHGQNLSGPEFVMGNRQWADTEVSRAKSGLVKIPADVIDGDIAVYALFEETDGSEWSKVWGDEFNDGKLDTNRWKYHPRYGATWNRLIAQGLKQQRLVNTFEDGYYNSHAIATPAEFTDETQPMISGAIFTNGTFDMTYGRVEARIKTSPHSGNFPAFWMMPSGPAPEVQALGLAGWPNDGEIDIWEQIDATDRSHHTVHSAWTGWSNYNHWPTAPKQASPASTTNRWQDASLWHVYAIEWDAETLRWYVDGNLVFTYANQHYSEPDVTYYSTERITWPFDKNFYIILNQSVGNGSWAAGPDLSFHYLTLFDYVRVYQKKDGSQTNVSKITHNGDDPDFYVPAKGETDFNDPTQDSITDITLEGDSNGDAATMLFDLNGRRVSPRGLAPGVYIEKTGSSTRKTIIR